VPRRLGEPTGDHAARRSRTHDDPVRHPGGAQPRGVSVERPARWAVSL
jgi:hypothetical protein